MYPRRLLSSKVGACGTLNPLVELQSERPTRIVVRAGRVSLVQPGESRGQGMLMIQAPRLRVPQISLRSWR